MSSGDGGATFSDHRPGAKLDAHSLAWHPAVEGRAYQAAGDGAAWSRDGGRTWQAADVGRALRYCWAVAVDPSDPERWYVSAASGPGAAHPGKRASGRLYRWDGAWRELAVGRVDALRLGRDRRRAARGDGRRARPAQRRSRRDVAGPRLRASARSRRWPWRERGRHPRRLGRIARRRDPRGQRAPAEARGADEPQRERRPEARLVARGAVDRARAVACCSVRSATTTT